MTSGHVNGTSTRGFRPRVGGGLEDIRRVGKPAARESVDVELFSGAGGLTLGLSDAGLPPDDIFEVDKFCCETLRHNSTGRRPRVTSRIHEEDIARVDWSRFDGKAVRLLSGGLPCQPFSVGGKRLADEDERNQFPSTLRAVRALRPAAVLLENVPGILRDSLAPYFEYVLRQLARPSLDRRVDETWNEHDERLTRHERHAVEPEYRVQRWVLNAADYGTAQARLRVFVVAVRAEHDFELRPPPPTHGRAALVESQESGVYWRDRGLPRSGRERWPVRVTGQGVGPGSGSLPWRTVRDALSGLPTPPPAEDVGGNNHWLIPGARLYRGHSGSELDWPAKTVKAGVHGVAGGENVVLLGDDEHRYFTLREMARLQGFPDDYYFSGNRSRIIRQVGNAVPCELAKAVGEQVKGVLKRITCRESQGARSFSAADHGPPGRAVAASDRLAGGKAGLRELEHTAMLHEESLANAV